MDIRNLLNICRRKDEREGGRKEGGKKYGNSQLKVNKCPSFPSQSLHHSNVYTVNLKKEL